MMAVAAHIFESPSILLQEVWWISHLLYLAGLEFHSWPLWLLTRPWPVQTSPLSCQSRSDPAERAVHCKAYTSVSFFLLIFYWIQILPNIELPGRGKYNAMLLILYWQWYISIILMYAKSMLGIIPLWVVISFNKEVWRLKGKGFSVLQHGERWDITQGCLSSESVSFL